MGELGQAVMENLKTLVRAFWATIKAIATRKR